MMLQCLRCCAGAGSGVVGASFVLGIAGCLGGSGTRGSHYSVHSLKLLCSSLGTGVIYVHGFGWVVELRE